LEVAESHSQWSDFPGPVNITERRDNEYFDGFWKHGSAYEDAWPNSLAFT
jgi:hypothetical protein